MATTATKRAKSLSPLVEQWSAPVIDAGRVHDELDRLWTEWGIAKRQLLGESAQQAASEFALMRASTLNLIVIADTPKHAERIEKAITALPEFSPSRTVILVRSGAPKTGELGVRVSVHEHSLAQGQAGIRFESVTVSAHAGNDELLASVTSSLLLAELPDFLWIPRGEITDNPLLSDLIELADRVIVDSASLADPGPHLRKLAELAQLPKPAAKVSDLVWSRLTPWRQLIAQFFDHPTTQASLECIDEVSIGYGGVDEDGRSGLTAGLLIAGWLATRLDWKAPGELVRTREGWRLTLRAGPRGRSREVLLSIRPTDNSSALGSLASITLIANGTAPGEFSVERTSIEGITTVSETPTMPRVSRLVYEHRLADSQLLSQELRNFTGDPIYEEALQFAADLWPLDEER
jgi:glucose-6-phosphate dehydrogenase assembly protein OpcA